MPSQTFTHSSTTRASRLQVWAALERPETWEAIGGVDRVFEPQIDGDGRLRGFSFETVAGGIKYVGTATPHERVDGERMSWEVQTSELRGVTSVSLDTTNGGTMVTVTLQVDGVGLLASMFFPVIAAAIGNGLPKAVDEFVAGFGD